jgi:hypothetical protein
MRYLQENESLSRKIFLSIAELTARTGGPVKLADIAYAVYESKDKHRQDSIRLTLDKTLVRCRIVDKIKLGPRDVRYFLTAYLFQEIQTLETSTGQITKPVGSLLFVPLQYWPISREYFMLKSTLVGCESALAKLEEDLKDGHISSSTYEFEKSRLENLSTETKGRLQTFNTIENAMDSVRT